MNRLLAISTIAPSHEDGHYSESDGQASRIGQLIGPDGRVTWKLPSGGTTLATDANKATVVAKGREVAKNDPPSELIIRNSDGAIDEKETYGSAPYPPRG